jgi:hypothetical protein
MIEDRPCLRVGLERPALGDADRCEHAEPIGFGKAGALAIHQFLQLVEGSAIADRQHVDRHAGRIGRLLSSSKRVSCADAAPTCASTAKSANETSM